MKQLEQQGPFDARQRGLAGAERAADHAERDEPGWNERTYDRLVAFLRHTYPQTFMAEDFVAWVGRYNDPPPDRRAYGHVIQKAHRAGHVIATGFAPAKSSNGSPKVRWMARLANLPVEPA